MSVAGTFFPTNHSISPVRTNWFDGGLFYEPTGPNLEIQSKLDRICNGMEVMSDKLGKSKKTSLKIKEAVYNLIRVCMLDLENLSLGNKPFEMIWTLFSTVVA